MSEMTCGPCGQTFSVDEFFDHGCPGKAGRGRTPWRHGDVGRIQRCVPGGDPYWITLVWRDGGGWYNVAGTLLPLNPQPTDDEIELLIRDHEPLTAPARGLSRGGTS